MSERLPVPKLSDAAAGFSLRPPLPAWGSIPDDFKSAENAFHIIATQLSAAAGIGASVATYGLQFRDGIDHDDAMRAIRACFRALTAAPEHKIAGVAYMLAEWFEFTPRKEKRKK